MYEIVYSDDVGEWVAQHIQGMYVPNYSKAIGLCHGKSLVAGIIYETWNRQSIVCHIAIRGRITREWLHKISAYPFWQLKVYKVIAPVDSDNLRSVNMVRKMGFREEGRIRNGQPKGDLILFTLTEKDCPYLGGRFGETRYSTASA